MKLGIKIILPILLLLVIVTGAFGYILYNLKQQETVISTEGAKIRTLNGLNERLIRQQEQTENNILAYRFNQDKAYLLAIFQAALDKAKTLDEMYPFITTTRGRELVTAYIESRNEIESLRNDLIKAIDEGDQEQIALNYNKWNIQTQNIKAALADIGAYNINSLEKTLVAVGDIRNKISGIIFILLLVVVATVLFLFFYLRAIITIPIIKLAQFADEVANKNFDSSSSSSSTRKDELGILSRAFNTMVSKLKESYGNLEQKVRDRTRALEEIKGKDEAIISSIGDGVAIADEKGKLVFFNQTATDILGGDANQAQSDTWQEKYGVFDAESLEPLPAEKMPLALAVSGKTVSKAPLFIRNAKSPDGKFISVTATPVFMNGKSIGGVAIFRDMTQERNVDKAKTEFVSLASHQLRTPLSAIRWYAEALLSGERGVLTKDQKEYVGVIDQSNKRMITLVDVFLDVSHLELGTFVVKPAMTVLEDVAKSVVAEIKALMQEEYQDKKLEIRQEYAPNLIPISVDSKLIRVCMQNLISNAVKYTPAGGSVTIRIARHAKGDVMGGHTLDFDGYVFEVSDTGYGISSSQQDKIFTKLFRADNIRVKDTSGTGLGLYIVKQIMEISGGRVWFESEENKGSAFYILIPLL